MTSTVALFIYDDVLLLDIAGPAEVFSVANRFLPEERHYQLLTLGLSNQPVRASNGITLVPDRTVDDMPTNTDMLLIPGGPGAYNNTQPELYAWLPQATQNCQQYGSICTGAFILGRAGLLDQARVTTHWNYTSRLSQYFPSAKVESDKIFLRDGPLLSTGGVTTGIDLALFLIEEAHGKEIAIKVSKVLLVSMRRQGGAAQFTPLVAETIKGNTVLSQVQQYVIDNITEDITVQKMADMAKMSPRHFARQFSKEINLTPMEFVQSCRLDHARTLLESSDLPLKTIAFRSGFSTARQMRNIFNTRLDITPDQYRRQFR